MAPDRNDDLGLTDGLANLAARYEGASTDLGALSARRRRRASFTHARVPMALATAAAVVVGLLVTTGDDGGERRVGTERGPAVAAAPGDEAATSTTGQASTSTSTTQQKEAASKPAAPPSPPPRTPGPASGAIVYATADRTGSSPVDLMLVQHDGSGERKLFSGEDVRPLEWSPDRQRILVYTDVDDGSFGYEFYVVRADGSGTRKIASDWLLASWSPDGRWLAFSGADGIWVGSAEDGREARRLTPTTASVAGGLAWSPDSTRIAFEDSRNGPARRYGNQRDIYVVDVGTGRETRSTTSAHDEVAPYWSPNGDWVSFLDDQEKTQVGIVRPDGTGFRDVTAETWGAGHAYWVNGETELVYQAYRDQPNLTVITVVDVATGATRELLRSATATYSGSVLQDVSPNGDHWLYVVPGEDGAREELRRRGVDGTGDHLVARNYFAYVVWTAGL